MIIFLDIDGVLVHKDCPSRYSSDGIPDVFDSRCVYNLNHLIKTLKADIVISSFWKHFHSFKEIKGFCFMYGVQGRIIGQTPTVGLQEWHKGREIKRWIEDNDYKGDYLVIDDERHDKQFIPEDKLLIVENGWGKGGLGTQDIAEYLLRRQNETH